MTNIEKWIKQLTESTDRAAKNDVCNALCAIAEPWFGVDCSTLPECRAYWEFMDTDPDNWAMFIKDNFGTAWGDIAVIIIEEGY